MASLGVELDPWQADFLEAAMAVDGEGRWVSDEAALVAPRQNGKGIPIVARALWGCLEGGDELCMWTAHQLKTAAESFRFMKQLVEQPVFAKRFGKAKVSTANGKEHIAFENGSRILIVARSRTSGRGFSPDFVVLDESFELDDLALSAVKPSLAARPNPAMWFASSAPHETSTVLRRVCLRGRSDEPGRLTYFEYCADENAPPGEVSSWLESNPGIGYRITLENVMSEFESMKDTPEHFARERLGIWQEEAFRSVFNARQWELLGDRTPPKPSGTTAIAVDVTPDRRRTVIAAAGDLGGGLTLCEILGEREGVLWAVDAVAELVEKHSPDLVLVDGAGQSQTLIAPLQRAGVEVRRTSSAEMVAAAGAFYDAVLEDRLVHMDQPELNAAVEGARQRHLGDGWAWGRRSSNVNVSPLVAASLAVFGVKDYEPPQELVPLWAFK